METVGPVAELQAKDIVRGSVRVQSPSDLPAADEAVLAPQHDDGPVDQLHQELLSLSYMRERYMYMANVYPSSHTRFRPVIAKRNKRALL